MPESPNEVSSGQRRANWVALRTLRLLPKAVGETAEGEQVYEVRSVPLLLDGTAGHFVRLTECSRCGRQLAGAPVLTVADLDRPLRPLICADCIRGAGVSTVWEVEGGEPAGARPAPASMAATLGHAAPAAGPAAAEASPLAPAPAAGPAEAKPPERLHVMEAHLRAVTDRVNELGRITRAHQAELKERAGREEAAGAALRDELGSLRDELAAFRDSTKELRAEVDRLAGQAEIQRLVGAGGQGQGDSPAAAEVAAGLVQLRGEVAQLARVVEAQRGEVVGFVAAVGETQKMTGTLSAAHRALAETVARADLASVEARITARLDEVEGGVAEALARPPAEPDLSTIEELIATRVAEAERRLTNRIAGQWGDLETAIKRSVKAYLAGFERANEALAVGQAVLEERIEALADQVIDASRRLEAVRERVAAREAMGFPVPAASPGEGPSGSFLDSLDRQLDAAARRLAARSQTGAGGAEH